VKAQSGYGVTVQLSKDTFGSCQYCEVTDELQGNILGHLKSKGVFLARVIDTDKKGRPMLSARDSVIQEWQSISSGSTAAFQQKDQKS
jgi:predicted RNA-binding protein with RPS1 domain